MALPQACCSHLRDITASSTDCDTTVGGARTLKLACMQYVTSFTQRTCDDVTTPNAAIVEDIITDDGSGNTQVFFDVETRDKTLEYVFDYTYDPDTGSLAITETINFDVNVKGQSFYCSLTQLIGQEVVGLIQEKGSLDWYVAGRDGDLTVTNISGGTGTTDFTPTSFVITNTDSSSIWRQFIHETTPGTDDTDSYIATTLSI